MFAATALCALLIEAAAGYPDALFRRIGHPVTWMGALISACERRWNRATATPRTRRLAGVATVLVLLAAGIATGLGITHGAERALGAAGGFLITALCGSTLIAQRSLYAHVAAVADGLEQGGLVAGRAAVSMIVGRDPERLDEAGVARAAIESLAENFSDGIVAPVLWLAVAGLPGAICYKAINTADSMIGHKSERYLEFGWAAARTDDVANLPASRISALLLAAAAGLLLSGACAANAIAAVRSDARRHRSPNAGWPEAAMAGALGLRLAGPRVYASGAVDDAWMGSGRAAATAADIRAGLSLYRAACVLQAVLLGAVAALLWRVI